jgi:hypothetical protein
MQPTVVIKAFFTFPVARSPGIQGRLSFLEQERRLRREDNIEY